MVRQMQQTNPQPCEACGGKCAESNIAGCAKWKSWFIGEWARNCAKLKRPQPKKKTIYDHERSFFVYENPSVTRQRMKEEAEQTEGKGE